MVKKRIAEVTRDGSDVDFIPQNFMLIDGAEGSAKMRMDLFGKASSVEDLQAGKQDKLILGDGISIDSDNVISYTGCSDAAWAHLENSSFWAICYNDSVWYDISQNLRTTEGELLSNLPTSVLPAGLYDFKVELAFKTIEGYQADVIQRTEMQIKYGDNVLSHAIFTFDGTLPVSRDQTAWSGGLFKMPTDGKIKIVVKMTDDNDSIGFRARLKVSHLFIRKVG